MKKALAAFARNTVFANIMLVMIFMAGGLSVWNMTRESFPEFSLDMVLITVPYPGADPEEVEEGVSRKIEEALEGLEGLKLIVTNSKENVSVTRLEVKENYSTEKVLDDVRTKINAISTFPVDAEKPAVLRALATAFAPRLKTFFRALAILVDVYPQILLSFFAIEPRLKRSARNRVITSAV